MKAGHIHIKVLKHWAPWPRPRPEDRLKTVDKEIIVYCGVGGYGSTVWYVMSRVLGYNNVKLYDGSAQGWVKQNDMAAE